MNKVEGVVFSILLLVLLISSANAQNFPDYTDKYVNDFAKVLDSSQAGELRGIFEAVDKDTTAEMVFVSINDLQGYDISQYATEIGQKWGVGKSDKDNGIVILYATDIEKIYVAVGYGVEGILPDSKIGRLLDENYVPLRDAGNVSQGIIESAKALAQIVEDNKEEVLSGKSSGRYGDYFLFAFIILLFLIVGSLLYMVSTRKRKKGVFDFLDFLFIDFLFRMILYSIIFKGGNRSSGSSFGGGGGFGGGGSGGGGAGR